MLIKLDGQTIIGHIDERHPEINPTDWDASVSEYILVEMHPTFGVVYKYKYVDGQLVELTEEEKAVHPVMINNWKLKFNEDREAKISKVEKFILPHSVASESCKAAITAYIQTLRDMPAQEGFKYYAPVWPEVPVYQKA